VSAVSVAEPDTTLGGSAAPPAHPGPSRRADLLMLAVCVLGGCYLTAAMWVDPSHRVIGHNQGDQALFEWLLSYAAYSVTHGTDPLWTVLLNAPVGVNLAVNTSMIVVGTLLAPITLTLGAPVSFLVVLTANLILTPYAWYHVLSRHVVRTRAAAVLGGLFCGYAPGIVSHANGHLNFSSGFLVPFIAWRLIRLREPGRAWRNGLVLGLLVVVQFSMAAELTFFVALACAVFLLSWALLNRSAARAALPAFARGLAVTAVVVGVALAYPVYMQFAGPQRYQGIGFNQGVHSEDLAAYAALPYLSLGRLVGPWGRLAPNLSEETSFYGPVLLVLVGACLVVLWRHRAVRALAITGMVFAVLSLGPHLKWEAIQTGVPLPYAALAGLPVFDSALPARFALMIIPVIGVLLALGLDRALALPTRPRRAWLAAFVVALLPIVPLWIPAKPRDAVPHFFSSGTWRQYVHSGQTLVPVPPASDLLPDGQRWQAATNFGFAIPHGFFLGPGPDGRSHIGPASPRPTDELLTNVALYDWDPTVTDADMFYAREDLAYWHAKLIVLSDGGQGSRWTDRRGILLRVCTELFGPPRRVDDVWLWQVG
jgi:hypothetical protein